MFPCSFCNYIRVVDLCMYVHHAFHVMRIVLYRIG